MTEPIVKWVGGKRRLVADLRARMPTTLGRYFEPFAGGAALFFAVEPQRAVLGDANADLIAMYRELVSHPEAVIGRLDTLRELHSAEHYTEARAVFNERTDWLDPHERAAYFIYLNRTCFNGLWRVNRKDEFNVPMDTTRSTFEIREDDLRAASTVLQRAELRTGDFRSTCSDAVRGDFVYFDPPYVPVTKTANFTAYAAGGFGPSEQRDLADLVRSLTARGVYTLASNSDTPLVRELYDGMRIDVVQCDRRVNSKASGRGKVGEVIVVGEPPKRVYRSVAPRSRKRAGAVATGQLSFTSVLATQQGAT